MEKRLTFDSSLFFLFTLSLSSLSELYIRGTSMDTPFDADNFLAELFGEGITTVIELEKVIHALASLPGDFEFKKYAFLQILDRRGLKLERWMVDMLRSG